MTAFQKLLAGLLVAAAGCLAPSVQAAPLAVVYDEGTDTLQIADVDTLGNLAPIGAGIGSCCELSGALATRSGSVVYVIATDSTTGIQTLLEFDANSGNQIGAAPALSNTSDVLAVAWDLGNSRLLALTKTTGSTELQLNSVDVTTGAYTPIGAALTDCCAVAVGVDVFDDATQTWFFVAQPDSMPTWQVYSVDVSTGMATSAALTQPPVSLSFDGQLFALYFDSVLGGQRLATLDAATGNYTNIGPGAAACCFSQPGVATVIDDNVMQVARLDVTQPLTFYAADVITGNITPQMTPLANTIVHALLGDIGPTIVEGNMTTVMMDEDSTPTAFMLSLNATDPAAGGLTWSVSSPAGMGSAGVSPGTGMTQTVSYTPNADANGMDSFVVTVTDTAMQSDSITVNVDIAPVNDAPSFVVGPTQNVLEDDPAQTIANWATSVSAGPANEGGQLLTFMVSNDNNALFSVQPSVDASGTLTYTLTPDAFGSANLMVQLMDDGGTANGGVDTSGVQMATINVASVNDAPSFVAGPNQMLLEDAGAQSVPAWATAISAGPANESGQSLSFAVSNDNNALFSVQPSVSPAGTLSYTPAANAFGSATVSVQLMDDGGTANGGVDVSAVAMFTIDITGVNDAPSFVIGPDQTILEDAGAQSTAAWATMIDPGTGEGGQTLTFMVSNDNNALFSVQPSVAPDGTLSYTAAADANGSATVTVTLMDDGGTANGGVDTSAPQMAMITVTPVNDAPSFTPGGNQAILEDSGAQSVPAWATGMSAGPADESGQTLTFVVTTDNDAAFSALPAVDTVSGELTYTPAPDAFGLITVTVVLMDDGGTANGGVDASPPEQFTIDIAPINDPPTFTLMGDLVVFDLDGEQVLPLFVSNLDPGPGEGGQSLTVAVTDVSDPLLFDFSPMVDNAGTLTFTPRDLANGIATVEITVMDDGGTANGGMDTTIATFTITVFIAPRIIPTLQPAGLLLMVLVMGVGAWLALRRRRGAHTD